MLCKTRTAIITLVATFSVGGAALVPSVAPAQVFKPRDMVKVCKEMKKEYEHDVASGLTKTAKEKKQSAKEDGCKWAGGTIYLEGSPTKGILPEGEPKNAPEPGSPPPVRGTTPTPPAGTLA
jgi:hypothetical protein